MDADARFARCVDAVLRQEGGYSDLPSDSGGATHYGISTPVLTAWRGHPVSKQDVWNLTLDEARSIYRSLYWNKILGDLLPAGPDLAAFDCSVNQGPGVAARFLQQAVNVTPDGLVGPNTVAALRKADPLDVIDRVSALRKARYQNTEGFDKFGTDWLRRVDEISAQAKSMVAQPHPPALAKTA